MLRFPVVMYQLEPHDEGWGYGARFMLEDLAGDLFHFRTRSDAETFMDIHGLAQVDEADMMKLRQRSSGRRSGQKRTPKPRKRPRPGQGSDETAS
jgi:hypothetical protein